MKTSEIITYCYLRSQRIELLCGSAGYGFGGFQLSLTNGMHDFNAGNRTACGPKGFEAEHGTSDSFYRSMVLLNEVVEIFGVADEDRGVVVTVIVLNRRGIRATLIDGNFG